MTTTYLCYGNERVVRTEDGRMIVVVGNIDTNRRVDRVGGNRAVRSSDSQQVVIHSLPIQASCSKYLATTTVDSKVP